MYLLSCLSHWPICVLVCCNVCMYLCPFHCVAHMFCVFSSVHRAFVTAMSFRNVKSKTYFSFCASAYDSIMHVSPFSGTLSANWPLWHSSLKDSVSVWPMLALRWMVSVIIVKRGGLTLYQYGPKSLTTSTEKENKTAGTSFKNCISSKCSKPIAC